MGWSLIREPVALIDIKSIRANLVSSMSYAFLLCHTPNFSIAFAKVYCSYSASVSGLTQLRAWWWLCCWFECLWYLVVAVEEVADGVDLAAAPLDRHREVGLSDGEVGESLGGAPAPCRAACTVTGLIVRSA